MTEHQLAISGRKEIIDHDVSPRTVSPEPEVEYSCVLRIPVLIFVIDDDLQRNSIRCLPREDWTVKIIILIIIIIIIITIQAVLGSAGRSSSPNGQLAAAISSKIEDGNIRAAVRILCSEDKPATVSEETFNKLLAKHPSAPCDRRSFPDPWSTTVLQVEEVEVLKALKSFPAGSSGGPDGLRPQHFMDLVNCREGGSELLSAVTSFINVLLGGSCNAKLASIFSGGRLIALEKMCIQLQPIVIGYTLRRDCKFAK